MLVVYLPVHVECSPSIDPTVEEELCKRLSKAGMIVSKMQESDSAIAYLLLKIEQSSNDLQKDFLRDKLKRKISTALRVGGIPWEITHTFTMVFVNLSIKNLELAKAMRRPMESIILYLKCQSLESLWRLREMILSGLLLRIFSEAIKQFIQSQPRVQLVVKREDFNWCVSHFNRAAGMCEAELF